MFFKRISPALLVCIGSIPLLFFSGCNSSQEDDARIAEIRAKYILADKPSNAISIAGLKQQFEGASAANLIGDDLPVPPAFDLLDTGELKTEPTGSEEKSVEEDKDHTHSGKPEELDDKRNEKSDVSENSGSEKDVTIIGQIGGIKSPFIEGHAVFTLTDPIKNDHSHGPGGAESCPFCSQQLKNRPNAAIQFIDEQNEIIKVDSRKLFGIDNNTIVVIRGKATRDSQGILTVSASGIYVEK